MEDIDRLPASVTASLGDRFQKKHSLVLADSNGYKIWDLTSFDSFKESRFTKIPRSQVPNAAVFPSGNKAVKFGSFTASIVNFSDED